MKRLAAATFIAVSALVAASPSLASPHEHGTHASQGAPGRLTLDEGRQWATDEPLRRNMDEIRLALAQRSNDILAGALTAEQARALGVAIEARVAAIVADCRLEPEADANLHVIVAELLEAADILQRKSRLPAVHGATKAVRASQMYATYFDHPGWMPVH